ncbi:interleukin-1 beta-like [Lates japonicus]|uniref:Interleukin-1 n=1 Tax=Lates japonicus TaxID=270547 RepID=A0AAD3MNM8_LATJO|nr:interleukin-1 beta-like protein [Lates japonicus]
MCKFDLSQALDSSFGSDDRVFKPYSFDKKSVQSVRDETIKLEEGLELVVSHNPRTMRGVATLLLAANRMKNSQTLNGQELSNSEICRAIMDSVVEETIVKEVKISPMGERRFVFERINSLECTLTDNSQKDIICTSEDLKLQAVTLKGGNCSRKVNFKLVQYISPNDGQTVVLSIRNHNLYISCSMTGNKAELNLEKCSEEDLRADPDMKRFLFFNREGPEICLHTFESVKYRGWFISTAYEKENEPLEMCQVDSAYRLTKFKIN